MEGSPASETPWWQAMVFGRRPERTLLRVVVLVVTSVLIFKFVLLPIRVEGPSMLPTYKDHGVNFVNKLSYLFHDPRRGDVVAIRLSGEHIMFMKRIVALPGETIEFREGHVVVNGKPLEEPYLKRASYWEQEAKTLGPSEYYVVGDNRSMPIRDHEHGKASRERIVGKVLL